VRNSPRERKTRRKRTYSRGDVNAIVDAICHPLADEHWVFVLVDGLCHAAVEDNPKESLAKFVRYNLPELLKRILKEKE
jgi:hypothetical protein